MGTDASARDRARPASTHERDPTLHGPPRIVTQHRLPGVRCLMVKSRGHFRAGFDEFFGNEQIVEVDAPGLTTPILSPLPFQHVPRPIYPLDADMSWRHDQ